MFKMFSGSSSSSQNTWNALADLHQPTVRSHSHYNATSRDFPNMRNEIAQVKSTTIQALADADKAISIVKNILADGAGNQRQDIESSQGESWARSELATNAYSAGTPSNKLKRAQKFQGGNCSVFAMVAAAALQAKGTNAPLQRVMTPLPGGGSHEYILLGDRRDPKWGTRNTVVVDAWPIHPKPTTLARAVLHDIETGTSIALKELPDLYRYFEHTISPLPSTDLSRLKNIEPMSANEVNRKLGKKGLPPIGPSLTQHALRDIATDGGRLFNVSVGSDPNTRYTSR